MAKITVYDKGDFVREWTVKAAPQLAAEHYAKYLRKVGNKIHITSAKSGYEIRTKTNLIATVKP